MAYSAYLNLMPFPKVIVHHALSTPAAGSSGGDGEIASTSMAKKRYSLGMRSISSTLLLRLTRLVLPALLLSGCASYANHEHAHLLAQAQQDDATCQAQGWNYPAPRYVTCRMSLQDQRMYRDWLNLQLLHRTQTQPTGIPEAYPYNEVYRPLDRDHFSCRLSHENSQDYVLCGEDEKADAGAGN